MCGILGPTAGESWLAYVGVSDEYPDLGDLDREVDDAMWEAARHVLEQRKLEDPLLRVMADERCTMWTIEKVPAGTLPVDTEIQAGDSYSGTWWGKTRARNRYDSDRDRPDRVYVEWVDRVHPVVSYSSANSRPDITVGTEVDARVPVPFDLAALLAEIEQETGVRCQPKVMRRKASVERTCDSCGRKGTRGFRVIPPGAAETSVGSVDYPGGTYCTGMTACRRRAYRLTPPAVRAARRLAMEMNA